VVGTLVAESLHHTAVLDVPLTLRRLSRLPVTAPADGQPATWTLIDFTCPDEHIDAFAGQLAGECDGMRANL
jgi:hypothetical protein